MKVTFAALWAGLICVMLLTPVSGAGAVTRDCGSFSRSSYDYSFVFAEIHATNISCRRVKRTIRRWHGNPSGHPPGWVCSTDSSFHGSGIARRCRHGHARFSFKFDAAGP